MNKLLVVLSFILCFAVAISPAQAENDRRTPVVKAVEAVSPSVVNITVIKKNKGGSVSPFGDPFLINFSRNFMVINANGILRASVLALLLTVLKPWC